MATKFENLTLSIAHLLEPIKDDRIRRFVELHAIQRAANKRNQFIVLRSVGRMLGGMANPVQQLFDEYNELLKNTPVSAEKTATEKLAAQAQEIDRLGDSVSQTLQTCLQQYEDLTDQMDQIDDEKEGNEEKGQDLKIEYQSLIATLQGLFSGIKITEEEGSQ